MYVMFKLHNLGIYAELITGPHRRAKHSFASLYCPPANSYFSYPYSDSITPGQGWHSTEDLSKNPGVWNQVGGMSIIGCISSGCLAAFG
jgi:hypothetical protein